MSAAHTEYASAEERYASDYAQAFDDFVRSMRRQGFLTSERVLEGAHDKATQKAADLARSRGQRSLNFAALSRAGLAKARSRHGY
jgi:hypothetical protein